jgi:hypothetical protein
VQGLQVPGRPVRELREARRRRRQGLRVTRVASQLHHRLALLSLPTREPSCFSLAYRLHIANYPQEQTSYSCHITAIVGPTSVPSDKPMIAFACDPPAQPSPSTSTSTSQTISGTQPMLRHTLAAEDTTGGGGVTRRWMHSHDQVKTLEPSPRPCMGAAGKVNFLEREAPDPLENLEGTPARSNRLGVAGCQPPLHSDDVDRRI